MKKLIALLVLPSIFAIYSCGGSDGESEYYKYNGHLLYTGEKDGYYYLSSGGNKEYVDKSYCRGCN